MTEAGTKRGSTQRQFNLWWALAISVLLHIVLALVSGWIPMISSTPIAEVPEDSVLRFTFNQPTEETVEQDSPPLGDVPFDTPPPQPQPSVDPAPPPVDPGFEVREPVPPVEQAPPRPEPAEARDSVEPATENPVENEQTEVTETLDPEATEIPEELEGPIVKQPGAESDPETATRPDRTLDLDRAMQDFGRQLDQARAAESPRPAGEGPPRNVFVPEPSEVATTGYGLGNLTFETADFDWSDYARSIYIEIWRAWHNRLLRLVNEFEKWSYQNREPLLQHWNQIVFVIESSGEVSEIMVETPSGCVPLDSSATQALEEVILPPLPEAFPKEREVVHARFIANGEIRFMRPGLTRMKALNYF
jgi:hypothetical protein